MFGMSARYLGTFSQLSKSRKKKITLRYDKISFFKGSISITGSKHFKY